MSTILLGDLVHGIHACTGQHCGFDDAHDVCGRFRMVVLRIDARFLVGLDAVKAIVAVVEVLEMSSGGDVLGAL